MITTDGKVRKEERIGQLNWPYAWLEGKEKRKKEPSVNGVARGVFMGYWLLN